MAAFFMAAPAIDAAVSAFVINEGPLSLEAATALGRALWALNAEAVRWRYDLDTGSEAARAEHAANLAEAEAYAWTPRDLPFAVMVKSVRRLRYQCSEGPVMETDLYRRMNGLCQSYEQTGVYDTAAYHRAPWGLEDARAMADTSGDPIERLEAVGRAYLAFAAREPALFALMFGPWGAGGPANVTGVGARTGLSPAGLLSQALDDLVGAGRIGPAARAGAGALVWPAVHGLAALAGTGAWGGDRDEAYARQFALVTQALGAAGGATAR